MKRGRHLTDWLRRDLAPEASPRRRQAGVLPRAELEVAMPEGAAIPPPADVRDLVAHLDDYADTLGFAGELGRERLRQIIAEGHTTAADDLLLSAELSCAAAAFALLAAAGVATMPHEVRRWAAEVWPFAPDQLREKRSARRMLVIAGALILAELGRLDRRGPPPTPGAEVKSNA
jgi:hypothetical protein